MPTPLPSVPSAVEVEVAEVPLLLPSAAAAARLVAVAEVRASPLTRVASPRPCSEKSAPERKAAMPDLAGGAGGDATGVPSEEPSRMACSSNPLMIVLLPTRAWEGVRVAYAEEDEKSSPSPPPPVAASPSPVPTTLVESEPPVPHRKLGAANPLLLPPPPPPPPLR